VSSSWDYFTKTNLQQVWLELFFINIYSPYLQVLYIKATRWKWRVDADPKFSIKYIYFFSVTEVVGIETKRMYFQCYHMAKNVIPNNKSHSKKGKEQLEVGNRSEYRLQWFIVIGTLLLDCGVHARTKST
jgi:hypothetical protein